MLVHDSATGDREGREGEGAMVTGGEDLRGQEDGGKAAGTPLLVGLGLFETFLYYGGASMPSLGVYDLWIWTRSRCGAGQGQGTGARTT